MKKLFRKLFELYCRIVLTIYVPVKVHGRQDLPKAPYLLISNHNSHLDYIILAVFSGLGFTGMSVVAAQDYWFDNGLRSRFIRFFFNAIPVDRKILNQPKLIDSMVSSCKKMLNKDKNAKALVVFPEGKRGYNGGVQAFKGGAAIMANELDLPVVPAFIYGSHSAWPKGKYFILPARVHVYFGKPIDVRKFSPTGSPTGNFEEEATFDFRAATDELEKAVKELRNEHEKKN